MTLTDCQATARVAYNLLGTLPDNIQVALTTYTNKGVSFMGALNLVRCDLDEGHIKPT